MKSCVLFQPSNGVGIGHLIRLAAIASAAQSLNGQLRGLFAVEASCAPVVQELGVPHVFLPPASEKDTRWNAWPPNELNTKWLRTINAMFDAWEPSAAVFDGWPHPAVLKIVLANRLPFVFVVRKMMDVDRYIAIHRVALEEAAAIIVPHRSAEWQFRPEWEDKTYNVGRVSRPLKHARQERSVDLSIVVTGGGGGFTGTVDFYNIALQAIDQLRRSISFSAILVTGPLFKEWQELRLVDGVRLLPFEPDLPNLLTSATIVIAQAGYNMVAELIALGTTSILVPGARRWDDQQERATLAAGAHPHISLFSGSSPADLAQAILRRLKDDPKSTEVHSSHEDGATLAAMVVNKIASGSGGERSSKGGRHGQSL